MATSYHNDPHLERAALITPLLQRLEVATLIDRHLPPDPQLAFSHGRILSLLLATRLCQPTALINIPPGPNAPAPTSSGMSPPKPSTMTLGRALDAFFEQRHSILTSVAAQTIALAELSLDHLHFDPTHLIFQGAYASSQPRPETLAWPPTAAGTCRPRTSRTATAPRKNSSKSASPRWSMHSGPCPSSVSAWTAITTAYRHPTTSGLAAGRGLLRPGALLISDRVRTPSNTSPARAARLPRAVFVPVERLPRLVR